MAARLLSLTPYRALVFFATAFALATAIFLIDSNLFSQPDKFHESDYIMTFYVAGRLTAAGRADELYPDPDAKSFIASPFDRAAHALLEHLPRSTTGAYMYIPLVAGFFAPFSFVGPNLSLFFWQTLSALALALSCRLLSRVTGMDTGDGFFLSFLYAPVFLTLWAGQLGLGFGLLPLTAGYFLLVKEKPLAAGFVWSLLLLKPQFFFAAAFVSLAGALAGRGRTFLAMTLGTLVLIVLNVALFSWPLTVQWLLSHKVSEAYFFEGLQGIPSHLLTGLPANLLVLLPLEARRAAKFPLYAGAASLWLLGLWFCARFKKGEWPAAAPIALTLVIGVMLSALTMPHFLYYDLCVLLPAGFLLLARRSPLSSDPVLRSVAVSGWFAVSAFLPLLIGFAGSKWLPLLLELILLALFAVLLWRLARNTRVSPPAWRG